MDLALSFIMTRVKSLVAVKKIAHRDVIVIGFLNIGIWFSLNMMAKKTEP